MAGLRKQGNKKNGVMQKIVTNWRHWALLAVFGISTVLLLGESDSLAALLAGKAAGLGGFAIFSLLLRRWARAGKVDELARLARED